MPPIPPESPSDAGATPSVDRPRTSAGAGSTGGRSSIRDFAKRSLRTFRDNQLTDRAAALTFYGVLALFPALICMVALVGLFGQYPQTVDTVLGILTKVGAGSQAETLRGPLSGVVTAKGGAGALLGLGLLATIWAASVYISAFARAANAIYGIREGRPFWRLRPLQILLTLGMVVLVVLVAMSLVLSGTLAHAVGSAVGIGSTSVTVWNIAKWPFIVVMVMVVFSLLDWAAPNVRQPGFRGLSLGGVVGVVLWVIASALFGVYLARFGSYNATYGSLGGVIGFLMWLWLSNLALLLGVVVNAERERDRGAGQSPDAELRPVPRTPADDAPDTVSK